MLRRYVIAVMLSLAFVAPALVFSAPASACNAYSSSCNHPTVNVVGQVFVAAVVVLILGAWLWFRFGRPGRAPRPLRWLAAWITRRSASRD
jgi:membrane protein DedA with SNARE-associated domain